MKSIIYNYAGWSKVLFETRHYGVLTPEKHCSMINEEKIAIV